ncbi:MAG TPA: hypothetical protein VJN00_06790 [Steroidobacteraceae bacterium]|nr:hypothetical protein [Steroidobacteraceae bacterium]
MTAFAIGLLAVPCLSAAQEQGDAATPPSKGPAAPDAGPAEPRSFFPLLADEALKRGYELPLPYGASLVVTGLANREIEVTDVRLDLDGAPVLPHADFVNLGSSSDVFNANLKFDIFVLPFLNVYALLGYVYNESETTANITLTTPGPGGGDVVFERTIPTKLDGFIGGLGFALAGGYGNFFLVADASYIQSDLGFDDNFTATIATVRAGYRGTVGTLPLQTWLGVGSWDTAATAVGHTDLPGGIRFTFEADQRPHTKWMYDVGANFEFTKRFQLVADVGFDFEGGYLLVLGPTWRFGR